MKNASSLTFYFLLGFALLIFARCNLTKNVPEGKYLLTENELILPKGVPFKEDKLRDIIRQTPNKKTLGVPWKLMMYNSIDTVSHIPLLKHFIRPMGEKRRDINQRNLRKNKKRKAKQKRINEKRMFKALDRGENEYRHKTVKLKDTNNPRYFFREWLKYDIGKAPVIFDSLTMDVSRQQLELYAKRKGYFNASVSSQTTYNKKKKKVSVAYIFEPKTPFVIDEVNLITDNSVIRTRFNSYMSELKANEQLDNRFDSDKLGRFRNEFAEYARDNAIYGFRSSYISYEVDTINRQNSAALNVKIAPRFIETDDGKVRKPFKTTSVRNVYFHLHDTMSYQGNFKVEQLDARNVQLNPTEYLPTFDTLKYDWYDGKNAQYRTATFLYNGELSISPEIIEHQNFLEETNYYKGYYVDRSFNHLLQLDLFRTVEPKIIENEDHTIDVHYHLIPSKHQSFSFEPRATNSNGFLGVASSVNYQHNNIFGGGEKLKISFSGGFESQPPIFDETQGGQSITNAGRSFNTLEFGPTAELEIPGLFPAKITRLSKRQLPKTKISMAYNYQKREDFQRDLFQFNYSWRFFDTQKTQVFTVGLPFIGGFQYVSIDKSAEFENRLTEQNDLFLINAYSKQFIWKDIKLSYQYTNQEVRKGNLIFSYANVLDLAGNFASLLTRNQTANAEGFKEILGVRYSQFVRWDHDIRFNHLLKGERSMNYRLQIGAGLPYGNNGLNLPFDYSFFAGGSNDNRGFRARSLGPGQYKYYLDSNATATEIGDIRFGGSLEYRFKISGMFKGAVFSDFGNIWTYNDDPNRELGQFTKDWYKQLSLAGGFGLRVDIDFLIIRLDLGIPIRNPALPSSSQWIWQSREAYNLEGFETFGEDYDEILPDPFRPQVHIAIGYPF